MHTAAQIVLPVPAMSSGDETAASREQAFDALVRKQARFVFAVAHAVLRNADDAEDVVQELFLKLYRSGAWERFQDERAFLARAAWRMAVSRAARKEHQRLDPEIESAEASPEEAAIANDRRETVRRLVDTLPEELRRTLALSAVDGLDSQQIAEVMGIPQSTVRTRHMRARQILRNKLREVFRRQVEGSRG